MTTPGYLLSDDLLFSSKILATARAQGKTLTLCRSVPELLEQVKNEDYTCIILDLQFPDLLIHKLIEALQTRSAMKTAIVAYGSHVAKETLNAARRGGCHIVLTRSQFVEKLETDIKLWLQHPVSLDEVNSGRQSIDQN